MADIEQILKAIKSQRWFFFANNDKILFDRDTALIWANLNHFPYLKNGTFYSLIEVKTFIDNTNRQKFGGFSDWRIPKPYELWQMIVDRTFPFQKGNNWQIKGRNLFCVLEDGFLNGKSLNIYGENKGISPKFDVCVLPCSSAFVTKNYSATSKEILDIFTKNNLIPIFKDESINEIYKKLFVDKPAQKKSEKTFDYQQILAKYDTAATEKSPIKYFKAVLNVTDELLDTLQALETAQGETVGKFLKIALKLESKYTASKYLTPEENNLLAYRQKFLAESLEIRTDKTKSQILSVKTQAENFSERLEKINRGQNSIRELAELEKEPRPSFAFLVENLIQIAQNANLKIDFFIANEKFILNIVNLSEAWSADYKLFKTNLREELTAICREDGIEEEIFGAWYDDWQNKRFFIEQRFFPLAEFSLKGNLLDAIEGVSEILQEYKVAIDKFYLNERKNIYQKFAFVPKGNFQEKFETESEIYKFTAKFQRDLKEIIFSRNKVEEQHFLLHWAEPLVNFSIEELSYFVVKKELVAISDETLSQFEDLKRKSFVEYLSDSKSYDEAIQQREKDYNALIFRMRKDLAK